MVNLLVAESGRGDSLEGRLDFGSDVANVRLAGRLPGDYQNKILLGIAERAEEEGYDGEVYADQASVMARKKQLEIGMKEVVESLPRVFGKGLAVVRKEDFPLLKDYVRMGYELRQLLSDFEIRDLADEEFDFTPAPAWPEAEKGVLQRFGAFMSECAVPLAAAGIAGIVLMPSMTGASNADTAQQYDVQATVLDYADQPVANARFAVVNSANGWLWHGTTGADGKLDIDVNTLVGIQEQAGAVNGAYISNRIHYNLDSGGRLVVYNVPGQRVIDTQIDGKGSRGFTDDQGRQLAPGVYVARILDGDDLVQARFVVTGRNSGIGPRIDFEMPRGRIAQQGYSLRSVDMPGYEEFLMAMNPGVDFDGYEDTARVNMIPYLPDAFPGLIYEGDPIRSRFGNDDPGILTVDNPDFDVSKGMVNVVNKPASREKTDIELTITYTDSVNPSLKPIVVNTIFRYVPMDDFRGELRDNRTELPRPGVIIVDGQEFSTDELGYFDFHVVPADSHTVVARIYREGAEFGFPATQRVAGNRDYEGMIVKAVSYDGLSPDPDGDPRYTPARSRALSDEATFQKDGNSGLVGLKAIDFDRARDYVIWIANYHYSKPDTFSVAEQDSIEGYIRGEIFPLFSDQGNLPRIHKATVDEPYPIDMGKFMTEKYDVFLIMPQRIGDPGGVVARDNDGDGIIDNVAIFLDNGYFKLAAVQEVLSGFVAPNPVNNPDLKGLTMLHERGVPSDGSPTIIDRILFSIGEDVRYFRPLTPTYNVQGPE